MEALITGKVVQQYDAMRVLKHAFRITVVEGVIVMHGFGIEVHSTDMAGNVSDGNVSLVSVWCDGVVVNEVAAVNKHVCEACLAGAVFPKDDHIEGGAFRVLMGPHWQCVFGRVCGCLWLCLITSEM